VPMPPVKRLAAAGVRCFCANDNIRDAWSPFGNGDMLERVGILCDRQDLRSDEDLAAAFRLATQAPAEILGRPVGSFQAGSPADFNILPAASLAEAVAARPLDRVAALAMESGDGRRGLAASFQLPAPGFQLATSVTWRTRGCSGEPAASREPTAGTSSQIRVAFCHDADRISARAHPAVMVCHSARPVDDRRIADRQPARRRCHRGAVDVAAHRAGH